MQPLILASSSRYRKSLLKRLGLPFQSVAPDIDESALAGELPAQLAQRLAAAKSREISTTATNAVVIGSDQVAALGERILGKPGTHNNAHEQLSACSGQTVRFYTAVTLLDHHRGPLGAHLDLTEVQFRNLESAEIERYLQRDKPYDCAGSFKIESLGTSLFERIYSEDPTGLEGLPLIALGRMLRELGFIIP